MNKYAQFDPKALSDSDYKKRVALMREAVKPLTRDELERILHSQRHGAINSAQAYSVELTGRVEADEKPESIMEKLKIRVADIFRW